MNVNFGIAVSACLGTLLAQTITIPALLAATASGNTVSAVTSGSWSAPSTWSGGRVPAEGDEVIIPVGASLMYDVNSTATLHTLTIYGLLQFSSQTSTRLRAGLIKIGADARDNSANCTGSMPAAPAPGTLIVGLPGAPIPRGVSATIQLVPFSGQNAADAPGLINCGGRLNLQGATLNHPWTRLTANANAGSTTVSVADDPADWRVGDSIIVVGTNNGKANFSDGPPSYRTNPQLVRTEQRTISAISGRTITLSSPLTYTHDSIGSNYPEVANLTRTVVVESADVSATGTRGHTMYHAHSSGSVAYARFEGLGKEANLGRYPVHLHMVEDTMRGFSAIGNVVTNSDNKFYTIHGSDYALLRDNIGWRANTSGFFLEDGSEVYNVLDHNLAVNALDGAPAPNEHLSYLTGSGYGYWWANGRNTFLNNQAAENDSFAYFYESAKVTNYYGTTYSSPQHLVAPMLDESGTRINTTIHSVPFFRFDRNSCHNEHHWCFSAVGGAWTASRPSVIRSFNAWTTHYPFTIASDGVLVEGLKTNNSNYGPDLKPNYNNNRSWVSDITFKALQVERAGVTGMGLIAAGTNVSIIDATLSNAASIWLPNNTYNVTPSVTFVRLNETYSGGFLGAKSATEVSSGSTGTTYLNDWYGPGTAAKVIRADRTLNDGLAYSQDPSLVLSTAKAAATGNVGYTALTPVDDLAPATAITSLGSLRDSLPITLPSNGQLVLSGTTTDNGTVAAVWVNGIAAIPLKADYSQWEVTLPGLAPGAYTVTAHGQDLAGNVERNPHVLTLNLVSAGGGQAAALNIATTSLSAAAVGQAYSATLQASGGTAPYSWRLSGGALPAGLSLNSNGAISGTPTAAGTYSLTANVSDSTGATTSRTLTLAVVGTSTASLGITTTSLATAAIGQAYSATLQAGGGTAPYSWRLTGGALPAGLSLSSNGTISGTPSAAGTYSLTAAVGDALGNSASSTLSLSVASATVSASTLVARIDVGSQALYTDANNQVWAADYAFSGTAASKPSEVAAGSAPTELFKTSRSARTVQGGFDLTNGNYTVVLYFAETHYGSGYTPNSGSSACSGQRVFDVVLENVTVVDNLDICAGAGGPDRQLVVTKTVSVTDGRLNLMLDSRTDVGGISTAILQGIEIFRAP